MSSATTIKTCVCLWFGFSFITTASCHGLHGMHHQMPSGSGIQHRHHHEVVLGIIEKTDGAGTVARSTAYNPHYRHVRSTDDDSTIVVETLEISSRVSWRFAETTVRAVLANPSAMQQRQTQLELMVPNTAFISNFTMLIGGRLHVAKVLERAAAARAFDEAVRDNLTASIVSAKAMSETNTLRDTELFVVGVNIPASASVKFTLEYMQVLERRRGAYRLVISVRPGRVVSRWLRVDVILDEPQGVTQLEVMEPTPEQMNRTNVSRVMTDGREAVLIRYEPTAGDQLPAGHRDGISGDFVVLYDVHQSADFGGEFLTDGRYFVHFVSAPSAVTVGRLPKRLVFVIDISGSMSGEKIKQTRTATASILHQLHSEDRFQLILFDHRVQYWPLDHGTAPVGAVTVADAVRFVNEKAVPSGSTDIDAALGAAFEVVWSTSGRGGAPMVVLLTDGQPTSGVTDPTEIWKNVRQRGASGGGSVPVYSLGFGFDLNYKLLRVIAEETGGFARRIYDGVDAALQLEQFFDEVSTPLLTNVRLVYDGAAVDADSTTTLNFARFFNGSEIIAAGRIRSDAPTHWTLAVEGQGPRGKVTDRKDVVIMLPAKEAGKVIMSGGGKGSGGGSVSGGQHSNLERLYVYLKIKDLLRRQLIVENKTQISEMRNYALKLALDYHLVTPLTSLSIVQQHDTDSDHRLMADRSGGVMASAPKHRMVPMMVTSGDSVLVASNFCSLLLLVVSFVAVGHL